MKNNVVMPNWFTDASIQMLCQIGEKRILRPEETLICQGVTTMDSSYLVLSGQLRVSNVSAESGREIVLQMCGTHDILGWLSLFNEVHTYDFTVNAMTESEIVVIPKNELENAIFKNAELAKDIIRYLSQHTNFFMSRFRFSLLHGRDATVYTSLVRLVKFYGVPIEEGILIDYSLTFEQLAQACGLSHEHTNRIMRHLLKQKTISFQQNKIVIRNIDFFQEFMGDMSDIQQYKSPPRS